MHTYEIFSFLFVISVIIYVLIAAIFAFRTFIRGEHHQSGEKNQ